MSRKMNPAVRELRRIIRSWDGAWVRRWPTDEIWVGFKYRSDAEGIKQALRRAGFGVTHREDEMFFEIKHGEST
jgi:hypothetical protein